MFLGVENDNEEPVKYSVHVYKKEFAFELLEGRQFSYTFDHLTN